MLHYFKAAYTRKLKKNTESICRIEKISILYIPFNREIKLYTRSIYTSSICCTERRHIVYQMQYGETDKARAHVDCVMLLLLWLWKHAWSLSSCTWQPCMCVWVRLCAQANPNRTPSPLSASRKPWRPSRGRVRGVRSCISASPAVLTCELSCPMWYLPCHAVKGVRVSAAAVWGSRQLWGVLHPALYAACHH